MSTAAHHAESAADSLKRAAERLEQDAKALRDLAAKLTAEDAVLTYAVSNVSQAVFSAMNTSGVVSAFNNAIEQAGQAQEVAREEYRAANPEKF